MAKQVELNKLKGKGTCQGEKRPVWNNVQRLNHQNNFVSKVVLIKTGRFPVNVARQNISSQATATSTARKVNTARPIVNGVNTAKGNAVKSDVKGNWENVVKPSTRYEWRLINVLDNVSKDSASMILKRVDYIDAHGRSKDFKNHLSHNEESLGDDASKQGRIDIGDIDN
ncbi:hypothetical protein Tco_1051088 [Tanacetum coccineum]